MVPQAKKRGENLGYIDLYAGPGRYKDGTPSTPLLILEQAIADASLRKTLVTIFNDNEHAGALERNIAKLPGISRLTHKPIVLSQDVDQDIEQQFSRMQLLPSFIFVDPFGYKGVTLALLAAMLKDWGCDLLLFFSYNRINAAIDNQFVEEHTIKLFGHERLERLQAAIANCRPAEREKLILDAFSDAIRERGFEFVLPFTFKRSDARRTSHHLIFITKHPLAYSVMKDIMAKASSEFVQGVASFSHTKSLSRDEAPLLHLLERPIDELAEELLREFAGRTLTMKALFEEHHIGTRFVRSNYKEALLQLERAGKISASPPAKSRKRGTFADGVKVAFPK